MAFLSPYTIACHNWISLKDSDSSFGVFASTGFYESSHLSGCVAEDKPVGLWTLRKDKDKIVEQTIFIR